MKMVPYNTTNHHQRKNGPHSRYQVHRNWTYLPSNIQSSSHSTKEYASRDGLPVKKGAILEWRRLGLETDRMGQLLVDLQCFQEKFQIVPHPMHVFNMFRMIYPKDVRVVIIGQSPYPGRCTITNIPYACGPAFLPHPACATIPVTLRHIMAELSRDMSQRLHQSPYNTIVSWIDQGVLLLNASLTHGIDCPEYLEDHSKLWAEVIIEIVKVISEQLDPVFLLVGQNAWNLESSISSLCIKVSHPVSRVETATPWSHSGVFSQVSNVLIAKGQQPIAWI
jgi:uracil-DNA glycosylase